MSLTPIYKNLHLILADLASLIERACLVSSAESFENHDREYDSCRKRFADSIFTQMQGAGDEYFDEDFDLPEPSLDVLGWIGWALIILGPLSISQTSIAWDVQWKKGEE